MFKVGDKVERISHFDAVMREGKVYTVAGSATSMAAFGRLIRLDGVEFVYQADRFKLAEAAIMPPKPQALDGVIRPGSVLEVVEGYRPRAMRVGQQVTCKKISKTGLISVDEHPGAWFKPSRFKVKGYEDPAREVLKDLKENDVVFITGDSDENFHKLPPGVKNDGVVYTIERIVRRGFGSGKDAFLVKELQKYLPIQCFSLPSPEQISEAKAKAEAKKKALEEAKAKEIAEVKELHKHPIRMALKEKVKDKQKFRVACLAYRRGKKKDTTFVEDAICCGAMQTYGQDCETYQFALYLKGPATKGAADYTLLKHQVVHYERYLDYLLNTSPWAKCFIQKDVADVMENGVDMDCNLPLSQIVGAAIATREGYEHYDKFMETWIHLVDKGYNPNVAKMLSMSLTYVKDKGFTLSSWTAGHQALTDAITKDEIINFFLRGFPDKDDEPANSSSNRYYIDASIGDQHDFNSFQKYVHTSVETEKIGEGWDAKRYAKFESVYKLADTLEQLFKEAK